MNELWNTLVDLLTKYGILRIVLAILVLFAGWIVVPLMVGGYFLGMTLWSAPFYLTVLCGAEAAARRSLRVHQQG